MGAMTVVITLKLEEFHFQVGGRPEQSAIQALPSNRANESFNEGMRERCVRRRLDFFDVEDA